MADNDLTYSQFVQYSHTQLGHELANKYGKIPTKQNVMRLAQEKGIDPHSIYFGDIDNPPNYLKSGDIGPDKPYAQTFSVYSNHYDLDKYDPQKDKPYTILAGSNPPLIQWAAYSHELDHVRDLQNGGIPKDFNKNVYSNVGRHFQSDESGQQTNNDYRQAVAQMGQRLNPSPNENPIVGEDQTPPNFDDTNPIISQNTQHMAAGGVITPSFDDTQPIAQSDASSPSPSFDETLPVLPNTVGNVLKAGVEGAARTILPFEAGTNLEAKVLGNKQEIEARQQQFQGPEMAGELTGLAGPAIATLGTSLAARAGLGIASEALPAMKAARAWTQGGMLDRLATAVVPGVEGAGVISKIGSAAVRGAIENGAFQASDEVGKQILNPDLSDQAVSSALYHVGGAALFGAGVGGILGTPTALWQARNGAATSGVLKAITDHLGGTDAPNSPVQDILKRIGIDTPPEIWASVARDPEVQQLASTLNQSDTTKSGLAYQEAVKNFKNKLADKSLEFMGIDPDVIQLEMSKAQSGSKIGQTLEGEYGAQIDPVKASYEDRSVKYSPAEVGPSLAEKQVEGDKLINDLTNQLEAEKQNFETATNSGTAWDRAKIQDNIDNIKRQIQEVSEAKNIPGVKDTAAQAISDLVEKEGYSGNKEIMDEVGRVMERLPQIKTIGQLEKEMSTIGNNTASTLPFGQGTPLSRAGGQLKAILREAHMTAIGRQIGSEEGEEALSRFNADRKEFARIADLKDSLDRRLKIGGSVSNYGKGIGEMARTAGEQIWKRLSGERAGGDADILKVLSENFPKTAQAVKEAHLQELVSDSRKAAKNGQKLNIPQFTKAIKNLSPELRDFILDKNTQQYVSMIEDLGEKLQDPTHNFSNTARTMDKLLSYLPASAAGLVTMMFSHNPVAALIVGGMVKPLSKDAPDAIRLSLLKFLGSNKSADPSAFRSMLEFVHNTAKGASTASNAVDSVFKAGSKVTGSHVIPQVTDEDKKKLDEQTEDYHQNPGKLLNAPNKTTYYMPEHGTQLAQTAARVSNYLGQLRPPDVQSAPLDRPMEPDANKKMAYDRALTVAHQPLSLIPKISDGTLMADEVKHFKTMYPAGYADISQKLVHGLMDHVSTGADLPYKTKMALSTFLGQPLDTTMTAPSMQAIIASSNATAPQTQPKKQKKASGTELKQINKVNDLYATKDQARDINRRA